MDWLGEHNNVTYDKDLQKLISLTEFGELTKQISGLSKRRKRGGGQQRKHSVSRDPRSLEIVDLVRNQLRVYADKPDGHEDIISQNAQMLGTEIGLSQLEKNLLCLIVRSPYLSELGDLMGELFELFRDVPTVLACLLGVDKNDAHRLIMSSSVIIKSGIMKLEPNGFSVAGDNDASLMVLSALSHCLLRPYKSLGEFQNDLLGEPCHSELSWSDFDHLGEDAEFTRKLIRGAIHQKTKGINILLYGPAGTGKTEYSKVLAAECGVQLISIGETDDDGEEATRTDRLEHLSLAQHILHNGSETVLLLDKMEDVVPNNVFGAERSSKRHSNSGSLVYLHRTLENTAVPTIWTTNDISSVRPSILRRFTNAIEFRTPPTPVRVRLWSRMLSKAAIDISDEDIQSLAKEFDAPPGVLSNAVVAVECTGGGIDEIRHAVKGIVKTVNGGSAVRPLPRKSASFDQKLLNADIDIEGLTESITRSGVTSGLSLCLYGAAGTGKTAYVRHLAESLGMDVLQKRASDLLSKWIGETEQAIAGAFEEARASGKFLVFEEADSFLRDRSGATHSWEVTRVNEMLTWMEVHDLPFACTTNLVDSLDSASLRRFTFKIKFDFLTEKQVRLAFVHYFAIEPNSDICSLNNLTPGDFSVVKNKALIMGLAESRDQLTQMLREETKMKGGLKGQIGFIAQN